MATLYAVMISMIQKFFWNSLNAKDASKFGKLLLVYAIAVVIGPIVISLFNWVKERLSLMWRRALTDHLLKQYFENANYYKLSLGMVDIDNPDQRISDDVNNFTSRAVRFITVIGVGVFDLLVFSVILYRVYKPLLFLLIGYSFIGTAAIARAGKQLLTLNRQQAVREGNFRFGLVRVRDSTESIAFYGGEEAENAELSKRFSSLVRNKTRLLGLTRLVDFLSSSFRYWAQVVPTAVIAPQYFAGNIQLGVLSQVYFSFNHVLSSLGLIVSEFSAIAEFGAGTRRLKGLADALESTASATRSVVSIQEVEKSNDENGGRALLDVRDVSVHTPTAPFRRLVNKIGFTVSNGQKVLVVGRSGVGKSSLMRAICGLWSCGEGSIMKPAVRDTLFLPQRPFVMLGTLRENVIYPSKRKDVSDEEVMEALKQVNLEYVLRNNGGLRVTGEDLSRSMSLGEQQRLAFARVVISKPKFVILDESTSALDLENERDMYKIVSDMGLSCVSVGNRPSLVDFHDTVIRIEEEGEWTVETVGEYRKRLEQG